ncbi:hypothetical protein GUITHDRAFT_153362 [Guillardia theta CCMP2712]|uniref:CRAL-TRIO domain-containing protein n=4 Tax=Guillardia theta TaxID=55529 RepID=L1J486_GUITC|nr:hypothetical protein GUITHDRAFT_153362 [Guillardia theta CCMP2712]EKX43147.1 hypothetical protein GUITHDRAFT_153362 [Guillardia theta CCMP2712]|mmetsp:Transcript_6058/g.21395  ORF Transcript_6058/g.21395 Transcript_6058/m.21395 type:complete len:283 (+) Transcript_6058:85-933(+)|eukprot:XP_005830127.1 hypothetical protein GUITHDRAFT_153362 [Guillardia theta CCMP2712]
MSPIQDKLAAEEECRRTEEEDRWCKIALESLTDAQREKFAADPLDVLMIVRGFWGESDRRKAICDAIKMIADWRDKVGFYKFFDCHIQDDKNFHAWWPEKMYGHDKWGHFIQGVRAGEVDTDSLMTLSDEALESLQGQKMSAYQIYKHEWMMQNGSQRYKHTLCVDLTNMSMNMLRGKKRQVLQKIFHIGSTYYPESMWKIYLVNSPLIFRAIWAIIKPWLHPVTLSKIQIIGSAKEAIKKMNEEGIPIEAIPDWMGGKHPGVSTHDYISQIIERRRGFRVL